MSATDELLDTGYPNALRPELHKALKARGIDYWVTQGITFWNRDDGCECLAYGYKANGVPQLAVKVVGFTDPSQAIAATLGAGTCHEVEDEDTGFICCSECGAIHDESYTGYYCWCCGAKVVDE